MGFVDNWQTFWERTVLIRRDGRQPVLDGAALISRNLKTSQGGGIAAIFNSSLSINPRPKLNYNSFESLVLSLSHPTWKALWPVLFIILYLPPGLYSEYLSEF